MPQVIVGFIAAVGVPGLLTSAGGLTLAGGLVAGAVSVGLGVGLNYVAGLFMGGQGGPTPQDVKTTVRNSTAPRSRLYGLGMSGGAYAMLESYEGELLFVLCFAHGQIDGFEAFYADGRLLELDGAEGWATNDPYNGDSLKIRTREGAATQTAFPYLIDNLPAGTWTEDHRLDRIACALVIAKGVEQERFNNVYPNRVPNVLPVFRGARVLDPRSGLTEWTANLALCLRDYLTHETGARIPGSRIANSTFAAAADICDEFVNTNGDAPIRRYHGAVRYTFDEEPLAVVRRFLLAMDGRLYLTPEGKIGLQVGKWVEPTVTITDEHVLDFNLTQGASALSRANQITGKYTHAAAAYSETTAAPWRDEAAIALDGLRPLDVPAYAIQHHNHMARIQKIIGHRANPNWKGWVRVDLVGLKCMGERWIDLEVTMLGISESFEIEEIGIDIKTMTVVMSVSSMSSTAYDFDPATEEGTPPKVPGGIEAAAVPSPSSVVLDDIRRGGADLLALTVDAPPSPSLEVRASYKKTSDTSWRNFAMQEDDDTGDYYGEAGPMDPGTYEARARYVSLGRRGPWVPSGTVTIT